MNKIKHKNPFTAVPNIVLNDPRLTFKAKGIYSYLFSKPDGWVFYNQAILNETAEGITSFQSGIKELVKYGWLKKQQLIAKNGQFGGNEYELMTELPTQENMSTVTHKKSKAPLEKPVTENPVSDNPVTENILTYKEINNKEINKVKSNNINIITKKEFIDLSIIGISDCDNVRIDQKEYDKLAIEYPESVVKQKIIALDGYLEDHPKKYKSHYKALRTWLLKDVKDKTKNNSQDKLQSIFEELTGGR